ncbi:MAG: RelA/SpoT family protein [Bacteroidetes bacterium GWC2_33_15]|nr:MAG: RelA/SpoT family protein [Bacteroidetes bacterium GWA2_33_15]OFX51486.1 MAG: RelA/SpoT family protein [Bacteroidetes bacterium GWC2_33_15]OFX65767.1 MAG: RelA/SpoT family protein [Bacteroidetes bacterium GWB2_32_14]OFX69514.1 MAG: RelA/SpoT family protein [Bacteroidetes bacterium GWD2_33_33]HAN17774.1 RelA/SpoT family protein [Bacteroidales bacterium]
MESLPINTTYYLKERDRRRILNKYRQLLKASKNTILPDEIGVLRKAFDIARNAHKERRQPSGDPYIFQLLETSIIIVDQIGLGYRSVVAYLLFEAIIENYITLDDVEIQFDKTIRDICEGLIKIESIDTKTSSSHSENFRQLLITVAKDVRVILIKIAILLEKMRILNYYPEDIQIKTSLETFSVYAPLAHRLGLYGIKSELENLSMKYTEKETYKNLIKKLKNSTAKRNKFIKKFCEPIEQELRKQNFDFEIKGRPKSIYSIWQKIKKQNVEFEEVYDLFAIRIILNSPPDREKADCWRVFSIVTDFYTPNPQRMRDWISVPKSNGYESIHTTVIGPERKWVEVQIRTQRMDEIAEKGYAAHWKYKGIKLESGLDQWMSRIRNLIEPSEIETTQDIEDLKLNLYNKEIFVFTPNGDLKKFPAGATVLDFAYDIHTDIGNQCVGALINHKNVTIKQVLQNGDQVQIITSKNQKPKTDWLNFVSTSKAKTKIKSTLREEKFKEAETGKELFQRRLKNWKIQADENQINQLVKHYKLKVPLDLYYLIAIEKIDIAEIKEILSVPIKEQIAIDEKKELVDDLKKEITNEGDYLIIDDKIENLDYKLAKCCSPIFGDSIFGFVTVSEGIKIHRASCPNARQLLDRYNYRVINARWNNAVSKKSFQTTIKITGLDEIGMLNKITDIISKDFKVRMRSISMDSNDGMFEGYLKIFVESTEHLEILFRKLRKEKGILKVVRIDSDEIV